MAEQHGCLCPLNIGSERELLSPWSCNTSVLTYLLLCLLHPIPLVFQDVWSDPCALCGSGKSTLHTRKSSCGNPIRVASHEVSSHPPLKMQAISVVARPVVPVAAHVTGC